MKIVLLSYLSGFGGAEKQIIMLANAMHERGHEVVVVSIAKNNNKYSLNEAIKLYKIPDTKSGYLRIIQRYKRIKKILKMLHPDITINFWFQSAYLTALMPKNITGKIVYSERGDPGDKEYSGVLGIIRTITLPRVDGFVFQSNGAKKYFNKKIQSRSVIIHNPITIKPNQYPKVKNRRKAIVTVGRLHHQKNQLLLIEAFSLIKDKIPEFNLEIYGEGELESEIKKTITNLNLSNRVFLMGTSKRIFDYIHDAALFVLSSDYEGLPNALLEAMALGVPCISTDCRPGGAREIIINEHNGLITAIGDRDKLSKAIYRLLTDKKLYNKIENNCKDVINTFRPEIIYKEWEEYLIKINK